MSDYGQLAAQLAAVRRAWKRRRALAGLAIVCLESLGLFTLFLLTDWLYRPSPLVRTGLLCAAGVVVAVLIYRHILVYVLRKVPDEQVALYIEEHRREFQGALVTAAEFGRGRDLAPGQARIIAAILDSAAARASGTNLKQVVSLRRFRKYGWAAVVLLVIYVGICALFPQTVGHHAARVLTPWKPTAEDLATGAGQAGDADAARPITFDLSKGDARLPRGGQFDLEAVLSRAPADPVVLRFRPCGEGAAAPWRDLPMKETDRLHGFAASLRDVNEDLEFYVSTGTYRSETHRITVYSPLVVEGIETATVYPAYLKLPECVEPSPAGDVAAPVGSRVTVRFRTNNRLASGVIRWEGGAEEPLQVEGATAAASFEVGQDGAYRYVLRDADGQEVSSTAPAYVRALKDQPPSLDVKFPKIDVATHPLGQVSVSVDATDDWAVERAEVVYQVAASPAPPEVRLPLALGPARPAEGGRGRTVAATGLLALEDVKPALRPGSLITYHVEVRDQKGQKAVSDIYMITVTPFEQWASWAMEMPEFGTHGGYLSAPLSVVLAAVWHLHTQKEALPEDEFNRQSEALAKVMVDPSSGEVFPFVDLKKVPPDRIEIARRVGDFARKAHAELLKHDTAKAVEYLRLGVAELALLGLSDEPLQVAQAGGAMGGAPQPKPEAALQQIAMFMLEAKAADASMPLAASNFEIVAPEYRRELRKIEEAEKLKKKAEDLHKAEQSILEKAMAMADEASQAAAAQQQDGRQPAGKPPAPADAAADLARQQKAIAEQTKAAALDARAAAAAESAFTQMADRMDEAARNMFAAAARMNAGQTSQAVADVRRAQENLIEAVKSVQGLQWQGLEQAIDLAQARAERLLREQRETRAAAAAAAEKVADSAKPDAARQRDLKRLSVRQAEVRASAETLKQELAALRGLVQQGARPDTTKSIEEAGRSIERHQVIQKMTNAAVELDAMRPAAAVQEQTRAEAGLESVLDKLREAAGTLASDYKSELMRARFEAERAAASLERLAAGRQNQAQAQHPAGQPRPDAQPMSEAERQEVSRQAAADLARLGRHLENRRLGGDDAARLRRDADDPDRLAPVLASDEAKREQLLGIVRQIGSKLLAEVEAKLAAERLRDFQREECPPQYRPLVNKYYELLGQSTRE